MTTLNLPQENLQKKKTLLLVDLIAQLLILVVSGFVFFVDSFAAFWGIYIVLGGYQCISSVIHLFLKPNSGMRKAYYPQLVIHLIVLAIGIFTENIFILYVELFATAITALYYLATTIVDFVVVKRKS